MGIVAEFEQYELSANLAAYMHGNFLFDLIDSISGDIQRLRDGLESAIAFGAFVRFPVPRIKSGNSGKGKFPLTLSGGNGLLSHSAFLQATL